MNDKDYKNLVASLGCIVCGNNANLHHPRFCCGLSQRANDKLVIPLCLKHHQNGGFGVAIHASLIAFEKNFGSEADLLADTIGRVIDIC